MALGEIAVTAYLAPAVYAALMSKAWRYPVRFMLVVTFGWPVMLVLNYLIPLEVAWARSASARIIALGGTLEVVVIHPPEEEAEEIEEDD